MVKYEIVDVGLNRERGRLKSASLLSGRLEWHGSTGLAGGSS